MEWLESNPVQCKKRLNLCVRKSNSEKEKQRERERGGERERERERKVSELTFLTLLFSVKRVRSVRSNTFPRKFPFLSVLQLSGKQFFFPQLNMITNAIYKKKMK